MSFSPSKSMTSFGIVCLFYFGFSNADLLLPQCCFDLYSLKTNDVETYFMCLFCILMSLIKYHKISCPFFNWSVRFFLTEFYTLWIQVLLFNHICGLQIFISLSGSSFHDFNFEEHRLSVLMKSNLIYLFH